MIIPNEINNNSRKTVVTKVILRKSEYTNNYVINWNTLKKCSLKRHEAQVVLVRSSSKFWEEMIFLSYLNCYKAWKKYKM